MITQIEVDAMRSIVHMPKVLGEIAGCLKRIATALEKMEEKDGPTIGQIVRDALEKGKKENDNEPVL